jgi:hypothetical protein
VTRRGVGAALAGLLLILAAIFGVRAYRSWQALHRPAVARATDLSLIQPWMSVRYVARLYGVPRADLAARLDVPPDATITLLQVARQRHVPPPQVVAEARQAVTDLQASTPAARAGPAG